MFQRSNQKKVERLVNRLSNREQSAIGDIQEEIQELRKEEKSLEERLADIQETYGILLNAIDTHMKKWAELEDLKETVLTTISD